MSDTGKTITCDACARQECRLGYPAGIPGYCLATKYKDLVEETATDYAAPGSVDIYVASSRIKAAGDGKWTRVQEGIEFARELKLHKIGLASCVALIRELKMVSELFAGAGFDVVSAACQLGRVSAEARGVPELKDVRGVTCNPIAQAEIMNSEGTELNYTLGLCLGHDILFARHSKAPVSALIVKDRMTGNNPAAALYTSFYRRPLWKLYCNKDVD
jgi:uncharacterized metal-binding protein